MLKLHQQLCLFSNFIYLQRNMDTVREKANRHMIMAVLEVK